VGVLRGSCLKQNIGDNVNIFLQNKRELFSVVVFCRRCSCKWRILAIFFQVNDGHNTFKVTNIRHLQLQGRRGAVVEGGFRLFCTSTLSSIFCFGCEPRDISIQVFRVSIKTDCQGALWSCHVSPPG